eukprot:TRINITY_DN9124_c0_g1_i1.p1 TRINITY_DN9124_c0_g1~~TRINITY_DN9124_c0_g1_i1.p1  ORF type:complete len:1120 (+),score=393.95 TRINITY_DN9124_c0_g1_i1:74-3433(+)
MAAGLGSSRRQSPPLAAAAPRDADAGFLDADTKAWRDVQEALAALTGPGADHGPDRLVYAIQATERVARLGRGSEHKPRTLAVALRSGQYWMVVLKAKDGYGRLTVYKQFPLHPGTVVPESKDEAGLRVNREGDKDPLCFRLGSSAWRRALLSKLDRLLRDAGRLRDADILNNSPPATEEMSTSSDDIAGGRAGAPAQQLLTPEDDQQLERYLQIYESELVVGVPAQVAVESVEVRKGPDPNAPMAGKHLPANARVDLAEVPKEGGWVKICAPVEGWICVDPAQRGCMQAVLRRMGPSGGRIDAVQLRESQAARLHQLAVDKALNIESGEETWQELGDSLVGVAITISKLLCKLKGFENKLSMLQESLRKVEVERSQHSTARDSDDKLRKELALLVGKLDRATVAASVLRDGDLRTADGLQRVTEASYWAQELQASSVREDYPIRAVDEQLRAVELGLKQLTQRLHDHLCSPAGDFRMQSLALRGDINRLSRKYVLRWRSHSNELSQPGSLHARWERLVPLMPLLCHGRHGCPRELHLILELRRAYTDAMQPAYREEVTSFFKELRRSLQPFRHKPGFLLGAVSQSGGQLELLAEYGERDGAAARLSVFSPSEPQRSRAGSYCSGGATTVADYGDVTPDPPEPSELKRLGLWPFRSTRGGGLGRSGIISPAGPGGSSEPDDSSRGGGRFSEFGSEPWGASSRGGSIYEASEFGTVTAKGKKSSMRVEAGLCRAVLTAIDVVLKEQNFLLAFFCFARDDAANPSSQLHKTLAELFRSSSDSSTQSGNLLQDELLRTVRHVETKCDKLYAIPIVIMAQQLTQAMKPRCSFLYDVLSAVENQLNALKKTWYAEQAHSIEKCQPPGGVKHCMLLPCFKNFRVLFLRIERLCAPLENCPPEAFTFLHELLNRMLDRLRAVSEDHKYASFFMYKNYSCLCRFLEDQVDPREECRVTELGRELVGSLDLHHLQAVRKKHQEAYISQTLLQDAFTSLFEFIAGVESMLRSHRPEDIQYQDRHGARYGGKHVAELLDTHTKSRHVEKCITAVYRRLHKHFYEHTTEAMQDPFMRELCGNVWDQVQQQVMGWWKRLEEVIHRCYPLLTKKLACRQDELRRFFKGVEQGG